MQGVFRTGGDDVGGADAGLLEFRGRVEALPSTGFVGNWRVGGVVIHVGATTSISQEFGDVALGVLVEVEGMQQADLSITASEIKVKTVEGLDVRKDFARTGVDSDARGDIRIKITGGREEVRIDADKLNSRSTYTIFINSGSAGNVTTDSGGSLDKRWRSDSGPPPPVRPVTKIKQVELRDNRGRAVLVANLN